MASGDSFWFDLPSFVLAAPVLLCLFALAVSAFSDMLSQRHRP